MVILGHAELSRPDVSCGTCSLFIMQKSVKVKESFFFLPLPPFAWSWKSRGGNWCQSQLSTGEGRVSPLGQSIPEPHTETTRDWVKILFNPWIRTMIIGQVFCFKNKIKFYFSLPLNTQVNKPGFTRLMYNWRYMCHSLGWILGLNFCEVYIEVYSDASVV